jgi:hypothetical protein
VFEWPIVKAVKSSIPLHAILNTTEAIPVYTIFTDPSVSPDNGISHTSEELIFKHSTSGKV